MLNEYLKIDGKSPLNIEYVCFLVGMEDPEDELSIFGNTTRACLDLPYTLPYKTKYIKSERFLTFHNELVNINVNMNDKFITALEGDKYEDATGVTVFAESVNQIRRLSLLILAFDKMMPVFVLDPTQFRPNLTFKTRSQPRNPLETAAQNKNIGFSLASNLHLSPLDDIHFNFYSFSTLHYVLNDLIPNLQQPSQEKEDYPNALSTVTDDGDEYSN